MYIIQRLETVIAVDAFIKFLVLGIYGVVDRLYCSRNIFLEYGVHNSTPVNKCTFETIHATVLPRVTKCHTSTPISSKVGIVIFVKYRHVYYC